MKPTLSCIRRKPGSKKIKVGVKKSFFSPKLDIDKSIN